jgi:two-component system sensor kinase FixL
MDWLNIYSKLPIALLLVDANIGKIITANEYAVALLQIPSTELELLPFNNLFPVIDKNSHIAEYERQNGEKIALCISIVDLDNKIQAVQLQEVHNWAHIKNVAEDKESRLQAIINEAVDSIITISDRGIIESINTAGEKLFGYTQTEVIGHNIKILMPEPYHSEHDGYIHNYQQTKKRKIIGIGREVTAKRKDGSTFPIHLSVSEVKLNDRIIYTGILHNLTDKKIAEEKIKRYAIELERSNLELQDFAYVSSHDLQEPLRKIRAFGDRLKQKEAESLSEKGLDYLNRMVNAAERMQILINDLLAFSRVSTHAKNFVQVDLNEILIGVLSDLELSIEQSQALIEADKLPTIEAEPIQMRQLLQNLIGNALKFRMPGTAPQIQILVELIEDQNPLASNNSVVKIMVKDNGIGFDNQYSEKIFQIFQRLEGRKYEGSGIGLAICKRITTRHGGDIEASSEPEQGTIFTITIPIKQKNIQL